MITASVESGMDVTSIENGMKLENRAMHKETENENSKAFSRNNIFFCSTAEAAENNAEVVARINQNIVYTLANADFSNSFFVLNSHADRRSDDTSTRPDRERQDSLCMTVGKKSKCLIMRYRNTL